jgi:hypothetical protein
MIKITLEHDHDKVIINDIKLPHQHVSIMITYHDNFMYAGFLRGVIILV